MEACKKGGMLVGVSVMSGDNTGIPIRISVGGAPGQVVAFAVTVHLSNVLIDALVACD